MSYFDFTENGQFYLKGFFFLKHVVLSTFLCIKEFLKKWFSKTVQHQQLGKNEHRIGNLVLIKLINPENSFQLGYVILGSLQCRVRLCTPHVLNTVYAYQEFCLAYFIYGSPSIQSLWLGKFCHLWFFWLLQLTLKYQCFAYALEPALNEVGRLRIWVPTPLPSIQVAQGSVQML